MWKKVLLFVTAVVLMTTVFVFVGQKGRQADKAQKSSQDQAGKVVVPVQASTARIGNLTVYDDVAGTVRPEQEVSLAAKVPGRVLRVPVKVGQRVSQGQILVELETTDLELQVRQAKAGLASARTQALQAVENRKRTEELFQGGFASPQQLEAARTQEEMAQNSVLTATSALDMAQRQLDNARMTAPVAGVVTMLNAEPGELVVNGVPLATVSALDQMMVEGGVGEQAAARLQPGDPAEVILEVPSRQVLKGEVFSVSPAADPQTRLFMVKVQLQNPDFQLKAGGFVRLRLAVERRTGVVLVPMAAVLQNGNENYVFVVEGAKVRRQPVHTGVNDGQWCEVLSGLRGREEVVTSGQESLEDGVSVTVVERGEVR